MTIDTVLEHIRRQLNLSKEKEWELLEEIRAHLEDAVADAKVSGKDEQVALLKAAEEFGVDEVGVALQAVHQWESAEVLLMCIVPVFGALVMRWLIFSAEGTTTGWQQLFSRPTLLPIALIVLAFPAWLLRNYRYALIGWVFFWLISIIFMAFPAMRTW